MLSHNHRSRFPSRHGQAFSLQPARTSEKRLARICRSRRLRSRSKRALHKENDTDARWEKIEDYGRTLSSMTVFPMTAKSVDAARELPSLEYELYLFHPGKVEVESTLAPTLNFVPGRGCVLRSLSMTNPRRFSMPGPERSSRLGSVRRRHVRKVKSFIPSSHWAPHPQVRMVDPGVVWQKLVVNLGGVKPSYLGPT